VLLTLRINLHQFSQVKLSDNADIDDWRSWERMLVKIDFTACWRTYTMM